MDAGSPQHFPHQVWKRLARHIAQRNEPHPVRHFRARRHPRDIDHKLQRKMREHMGDAFAAPPPLGKMRGQAIENR